MADQGSALLLVLALAFAVINGVNDGATLVATGLKIRTLPPLTTIALLAVALVVGPLLLGTAVAATLANRLVGDDAGTSVQTVTVAVVAATAVVAVLSRLGLPTSLTLALVGALAGAALGLGQPVAWATVALVLGVALVAPVLGAAGGWAVSRLASLMRARDAARTIRVAHRFAFAAECLAYSANDGQKMIAVAAVALGAGGSRVSLPLPMYITLAALFAVGVLLGLPQVARTLSDAVLAVRPPNAVAAELAAAGSAFASAAVGAPVSMTQTVAGGLIGSGVSESYHRVRWRAAAEMGLAWVLTLPAALGGAWAAAAMVRGVA